MRTVLGIIGAILLFFVSIFALNYFGYAQYAFFAPLYEAVRRDTFEQSRAFNEGMIRDLQKLQMEYQSASADQRAALRSVAIHRFSVYPEDRMPPDLRLFYSKLKKGE